MKHQTRRIKIFLQISILLLLLVPLVSSLWPDSNMFGVYGRIYDGRAILKTTPLKWVLTETDEPVSPAYKAELLDSNGVLLKIFKFTATEVILDYDLNDDYRYFTFMLNIPKDTSQIDIKYNDGIIGKFYITKNPPVITSLVVTKVNDELFSISWDSYDADEDIISYDLFYNSGGSWELIDYDITSKSYLLNTTFLGGGNPIVSVIASDGFNQAEVISNSFYVPTKLPEAYINFPLEGSEYIGESEIALKGLAYDPEDGFIENPDLLVWVIDGDITGYGSYLTMNDLSLGEHTITLTAADSEGKSTSATTNIEITTETMPDVRIKEISIYPTELRETSPGKLDSNEVFIQAALFNVRSDTFCSISFYEGDNLLKNEDIYLPANRLRYAYATFTAAQTGDYSISVKASNCDPEESETGNNEASALLRVLPYDTIPPNIVLGANPSILWPPNDKPVDVAISGSITDGISGVNKDSVNLIVDGVSKEIILDSNGGFNTVVPLIAKRAGQEKDGRVYNIELTASDNAGNNAITSAVVLVPHDQGK